MSTTPHNSGEPQLIRMIDQHGQAVMIDVRQNGQAPGLVSPGKRTRFRIRTRAKMLACRVDRMILPECPEDWHVHDVSVGGQSAFVAKGDSPEEDGVPGEIFAKTTKDCFVRFAITQVGMDLELDVAYHGPMERGAPFCCHLQCSVIHMNEVPEGFETRVAHITDQWGSGSLNTKMLEGTSHELGQQNTLLRLQVSDLTAEITTLRRDLEKAQAYPHSHRV